VNSTDLLSIQVFTFDGNYFENERSMDLKDFMQHSKSCILGSSTDLFSSIQVFTFDGNYFENERSMDFERLL
jgi:hypothetical protein